MRLRLSGRARRRVQGRTTCRAGRAVMAAIARDKGVVEGREMRVDTTVAETIYSAANERAAKAKGVKRVSLPNRVTKSAAKRREQKKRRFRKGQKWRTGCEGRISVAKRRHGLNRCRYRGDDGMKRWLGLGVIADNLVNIGRTLDKQARQDTA